MGKKIDPIIHFEMPAEDTQRIRAFYESAFGWQTHALGPEAGGFVVAFTMDSNPETSKAWRYQRRPLQEERPDRWHQADDPRR